MSKQSPRALLIGSVCVSLILILLGATLLNTALAKAAESGQAPTLASTSTTGPSNPCGKRGCPAANPSIVPGNTGQYSNAKVAISSCNGRLYVAWAGRDQRLNIGWGSTGNAFSNVVTFDYDAYDNLGVSPYIFTGPALACWQPSGTTSPELWVAWTDQNANLNAGYFDGNSSHNYFFDWAAVTALSGSQYVVQTSKSSPALDVGADNYLRIAWTGTDSNHRINLMRTASGLTNSWTAKNTWSSQSSSGGPGLASWCPSGGSCGVYIAWIGTDSSNEVNLGYFNLNSAIFTKLENTGSSSVEWDASLVAQGTNLYSPYAGPDGLGYFTLHVLRYYWSSGALQVSTPDDTGWTAQEGATGTVYNGHVWIAWSEFFSSLVDLGQYN
jgi:hypothetical protein